MLPTVDDLAELGAPVADVVVGDDAMTEATRDPGQGIPEDGAADVADMHRLGDIRRTEVDEDGTGSSGRLHTQANIAAEVVHGIGKGGVQHPEVDEAGSGYGGRLAKSRNVEPLQDGGGYLTGVLAESLGGDHRRIGLKVTESGIGRRCDNGQGGVDPRGLKGSG